MSEKPKDSLVSRTGILLVAAAIATTLGLIVLFLPPREPPRPIKSSADAESLASRDDPGSALASEQPASPVTKVVSPPARQPSEPFDTELEQRLCLEAIEQSLTEFPGDAKLLHLGAVTYAEILQTERALELFEASLEIDADNPEVFVAYGDLLLQVGRAEDAVERLEAGQKLSGLSTALGIALAKAYSQTAELEKALALLEELPAAPEYQAQVKLELAQVQNQLKQFEAAEANARSVVETGTTDRAAYLALSTSLMRQGKREEAIAVRKEMPEINQQVATGDQEYQKSFRKFAAHSYAVLGSAYQAKGLFGTAEGKLLYSLALDPTAESAITTIVNLLRQQGRLPEAIAWQKKAVELAPDNVLRVFNLASLAGAAGDLPLAESSLYKAVELDETGGADIQLAQFLMGVGKPNEAVQMARQSVSLLGSLESHLLLLMTLQNQGDQLAAAQAYLVAKKLYPDAPQLVGFQP